MFFFVIVAFLIVTCKVIFKNDSHNFSPVVFIPLLSIIQFGTPLFFYIIESDINYFSIGIEVLFLFIFCFQLGCILSIKLCNYVGITNRSANYIIKNISRKYINKWLIISIICSAIALITTALATFEVAGLEISFENAIKLAGINSLVRYTDKEFGRMDTGFFFYFSAFYYVGAFLGGAMLSNYKTTFFEKMLVSTVYLMGFLSSAIEGAKLIFLLVTICFIASYVVNTSINSAEYVFFSKKKVRLYLSFIALVISLFLVVQSVRYYSDDDNEENTSGIEEAFISSAIGHNAAFSIWYNSYEFDKYYWGVYSLAGVFNQLGIAKRFGGLYPESIYIKNKYETNVYTAYRGLIQDFGYFSFFIVFLSGLIVTFMYKMLCNKYSNVLYISILSIYLFYFWSNTVSIFNYNIVILSVFLFFLINVFSKISLQNNG